MIKESIKAKNKIKGEKYKIGKSVFVATIDSSDPNEKLDPKNIMLMFSTDLDFLRKILSKFPPWLAYQSREGQKPESFTSPFTLIKLEEHM